MNVINAHQPLNLSSYFLNNINRIREQNDNKTNVNNYDNININPPFRYYKDDRNLNLTPLIQSELKYKTKSLFGPEKPLQTEHDEVGINEAYLNKHFGYTNYGNFKVANQSLPEYLKHKTTPKNNLFDLF